MIINIVSAKRKDGTLVAKVTCEAESPSSGRKIHSKKDKFIIPLGELKSLDFSVKGGNGGQGGRGMNKE